MHNQEFLGKRCFKAGILLLNFIHFHYPVLKKAFWHVFSLIIDEIRYSIKQVFR